MDDVMKIIIIEWETRYNNNNDLLEKDGCTKNCMYYYQWSGIQGIVSAY